MAKRYGVSSNYLARVCAIMNVPRPNRGYWARIQAGHTPKKPELPPAGPEHELEWSRENDGRRWAVIRSGPVVEPAVVKPVAGLHPVLRGAEELFRDARKSYWTKYLKPRKRLVADLWISEEALPRAIKVASALFKHLDAAGLRVVLSQAHHQFVHRQVDERHDRRQDRTTYDTWTPQHPTVAFVGNVAIGLTVFEISDEREYLYVGNDRYLPIVAGKPLPRAAPGQYTYKTRRTGGTGRLGVFAYSPYGGSNWSHEWREGEGGALAKQTEEVFTTLKAAPETIQREVEESERRHQEQLRRWKEEERERRRVAFEGRRQAAAKQSREHLFAVMDQWALAARIEAFLGELEGKIRMLEPIARAHLGQRLGLARAVFGNVSALDYFAKWKTAEEIIGSARAT